MESSKKGVYTKPRQYEIMVEFMKLHPDLAKGHLNVSNAESKCRELWQRLMQDLNAAGPPSHEVEKWKKVWADFKQHIKVKSRRNKNSLSGTGGGPSKYCSLTPLEEQISELLAINASIEGMSGTSRFGAQTNNPAPTNIREEDAIEDVITIASEENSFDFLNVHNSRRRNRENCSNKPTLLEKQVENQIKYQEKSIELLGKCDESQKNIIREMKETNMNLITANKYLKRNSDFKERIYKLEKEKLEFLKKNELQKNERKERIYNLKREKYNFLKKNELERTKCKIAKLELKGKIFELESKRNG